MAIFDEPQKWGTVFGADADAATIPDTADETEADKAKIFPPVFSVPLAKGGKAIPRPVLNGFLKLLADNVYFGQQGGVASYDSGIDYPAGRLVAYSGGLYLSLRENGPSSTVAAPTSAAYWAQMVSVENAASILSTLLESYSVFDFVPDGAAHHNGFFRGKDITSKYNDGSLFTAIADGSFRDIFVGDYFVKSITIDGTTYANVKWLIADCDYLLHFGDTSLETHHVCVVPEIPLGNSYMNATNTTEGGYVGSYMYKTTLPKYRTAFAGLFGSHLTGFRQFLTNTVNASAQSRAGAGWLGSSTNNAWTDCTVELMNESMVYGVKFGGSGRDVYDNPCILSLFRLNGLLRHTALTGNGRYTWWLRDVSTAANFADVNGRGNAHTGSASNVIGVRPFCLIH